MKKKLELIMSLCLLAAAFILAKQGAVLVQSEKAAREKICIVVDAGHGGSDPGKVGINGALEKDINLSIALNMKALKAYSKKDSQIVTKIFDLIQDYMVTDMGKDLYLKIAMDALGSGNLSSENFYTIPGTGETTESFDVYHADRNMAIPILLNLFYREDK